ncbi:MAG TPA: VanZ family protein [Bacteroidales bacterium]|nr:VanZ family protein [Bacteroidales bacterium]
MVSLFIKRYYRSIIIGLLIVWLSLSGGQSLVPGDFLKIPYVDKIGHFIMYSLFSGILLLDSCLWQSSGTVRYVVLVFPVVFGALMEVLQYLLTNSRKAEALDLAADILGVGAGVVSALAVRRILKEIR